LTITAHNSYQI
jgi:hypothetical protein